MIAIALYRNAEVMVNDYTVKNPFKQEFYAATKNAIALLTCRLAKTYTTPDEGCGEAWRACVLPRNEDEAKRSQAIDL